MRLLKPQNNVLDSFQMYVTTTDNYAIVHDQESIFNQKHLPSYHDTSQQVLYSQTKQGDNVARI